MWPPLESELARLAIGPLSIVVLLWCALRLAGYRTIAWAAPVGLAFHWYNWLGYGRAPAFFIALGAYLCALVGASIGHSSRGTCGRTNRARGAPGTPATAGARSAPRRLGDPAAVGDEIALDRRPTGDESELGEAVEPPPAWKHPIEHRSPARVDAPVIDIHTRRPQGSHASGTPYEAPGGAKVASQRGGSSDPAPNRAGLESALELAIDRHASNRQRATVVRDLAEGRESVDLLRATGAFGAARRNPSRALSLRPAAGSRRQNPTPDAEVPAARGLARTLRRGSWGSVLTEGLVLEFDGLAAASCTVLAVLCEVLDEDAIFDDAGEGSADVWTRGLPLAVVLVPTSLAGVEVSAPVEPGAGGDEARWSSRSVFVPLVHLVGESDGLGRGLDIVRSSFRRHGDSRGIGLT